MPIPLGTHSPRLDAARALRTKNGRREQGRFAVEGETLLIEALASGEQPLSVLATPAAYAALPAATAAAVSDRTFLVAERALAKLSDLATPPGLVAVFPARVRPLGELLTGQPVLLLAGVADPGNAGTLVRSAEIFGFGAVAFAETAVEPYNPKVVRATMGALFRLPVAQCSAAELQASARERGYQIVAADRTGTALPSFPFVEKTVLAIGHERQGVGAWLERWDAAVAIPQVGAGESLNAAVAGGIILYAFSQRLADRFRED